MATIFAVEHRTAPAADTISTTIVRGSDNSPGPYPAQLVLLNEQAILLQGRKRLSVAMGDTQTLAADSDRPVRLWRDLLRPASQNGQAAHAVQHRQAPTQVGACAAAGSCGGMPG